MFDVRVGRNRNGVRVFDKNQTRRDDGFMVSWIPRLSYQRDALFRNNLLQKLRQPILKLVAFQGGRDLPLARCSFSEGGELNGHRGRAFGEKTLFRRVAEISYARRVRSPELASGHVPLGRCSALTPAFLGP